MPDDHAYYLYRALQERECADRASQPSARLIHKELAERYAALLGAGEPMAVPPTAGAIADRTGIEVAAG